MVAPMSQTLHEYVVDQLQRSKGTWPKVAKGSGVSRRTLEKIARREIADPGVANCEKLAVYFRRKRRVA